MADPWSYAPLGELAEFRNGVNFTSASFGEGVRIIGVSDFQKYTRPRYAELDQINPEGVVRERDLLQDGDVVFVRSNGNRDLIGRSLFVSSPPEPVTHSAFTIRARVSSPKVIPRFLAYYFRTPAMRHGLTSQGGGTNISNLNQSILAALQVPLPPLPEQRRIASILSAYDDLIENCERRIRVLDEMARALYREWFVNFRYPGHEKVGTIQSSLGPIPARWSVHRLGEVLELHYGKALKAENRRGGPIPVFASSGLVGWHDESLAAGPGIVLGRKGNVGSIFWSETDFFVIDTAYWVTSKLPLRFVYFDLHGKNFISGDAAVPGLSRQQAYSIETVVPPTHLVNRFCELAEGFLRPAALLHREAENLRKTRDLLLPRLLSGQLQVTSAA